MSDAQLIRFIEMMPDYRQRLPGEIPQHGIVAVVSVLLEKTHGFGMRLHLLLQIHSIEFGVWRFIERIELRLLRGIRHGRGRRHADGGRGQRRIECVTQPFVAKRLTSSLFDSFNASWLDVISN
jgi:hypothetical protein